MQTKIEFSQLEDAAKDGFQYGRQSGSWTRISGSSGGGISDAPMDGYIYGRQSGSWAQVSGSGGGGITDAPSDGNTYGRKDGAWTIISGTGGVSFSVYKWSGDIYPASPSSLNDEFDDGSLDVKWTKFDPYGNCTITETGTYNALLMTQATRGGDQIAGIYQTMPTGTNYTVYTKISIIARYANYFSAGIALWSLSTTGTMTTFALSPSASSVGLAANKWTKWDTYSSTSYSVETGWFSGGYIRVRKNGTNYYGAFSSDGIGWIEHPTAVVPAAEPRYFGIFIDNNNLGVNTSIIAQFFRYLSYDVGAEGIMPGGLRGLS